MGSNLKFPRARSYGRPGDAHVHTGDAHVHAGDAQATRAYYISVEAITPILRE